MKSTSALFCLLLSLAKGSKGIVCPFDFFDGQDGSCYTYQSISVDRVSSYDFCVAYGSYLMDVNNAFQNTNIQQAYAADEKIWLGLTCTSNNVTSCAWDWTGKSLTLNTYSNFFRGSPNISAGPCVYLNSSNGFWYNGDCFSEIGFFGCKYTPGIVVLPCPPLPPNEMDGAATFRKKCYWMPLNETLLHGYANIQKYCSKYNGTIVSIHSLGENEFIRNMYSWVSTDFTYAYIGLGLNNNIYSWDDGTVYDYSNFGFENKLMGNCVSMAVNHIKSIPSGEWTNGDCGQPLPAMCERNR